MKCTLYTSAFAAFLFASVLSLILQGIKPPTVASYAEVLPNGKVVIDKKLIESTDKQYPALLTWALKLLGNGDFAKWLMPLTEESIISAARSRSGLGKDAPFWYDKEFGEMLLGHPSDTNSYNQTYWLQRLRIYLKSINEEGAQYLSAFGRITVKEQIVGALASQLMIVDFLNKHPEIFEEKIDRPLIITGPPRTMTTHAQAILMNHPDLQYLRFADGLNIIDPPGLAAEDVYTEKDPRIQMVKLANVVLQYVRPFFPYMFRIEKESWKTPQEDIMLTQYVFAAVALETQTYVPSYSNTWHSTSNVAAFRFQKICHQLMQWQRRKRYGLSKDDESEKRKRFILKTPEYAGFLKDVLQVYPDAVIMLTHRDPVPVVESFVPMITYFAGLVNYKIDAAKFAEYEVHSLELRMKHLVEQIDDVPASSIIHIPFKDFVKDNFEVVGKVCKFANISLSDEAVKLMKDYVAQSPREGANRFEYRISTFGPGFSKEELRKRFIGYIEKFKEYL